VSNQLLVAHGRNPRYAAIFLFALLLLLSKYDESSASSERRIGDFLATAMPIATLGVEAFRGDWQGARQYATAFTATVVATEILKRTTNVERPDGTNDLSFPSGHAHFPRPPTYIDGTVLSTPGQRISPLLTWATRECRQSGISGPTLQALPP
jgi:hypothetical protein